MLDQIHPAVEAALRDYINQCAPTVAETIAEQVDPHDAGAIAFQIMLISQVLEEALEQLLRDYPHIHSAYDF